MVIVQYSIVHGLAMGIDLLIDELVESLWIELEVVDLRESLRLGCFLVLLVDCMSLSL